MTIQKWRATLQQKDCEWNMPSTEAGTQLMGYETYLQLWDPWSHHAPIVCRPADLRFKQGIFSLVVSKVLGVPPVIIRLSLPWIREIFTNQRAWGTPRSVNLRTCFPAELTQYFATEVSLKADDANRLDFKLEAAGLGAAVVWHCHSLGKWNVFKTNRI